MILIPHQEYRRAAELLEPTDLMTNILEIEKELKAPGPNWIGCEASLAEFGLTSMAVLSFKGFQAPSKREFFRKHYHGAPTAPRWIKDYVERTRSYLVLLGWLRMFEARGAGAYWCSKNGVEYITGIVARTQPKALLGVLKNYDDLLTQKGLPPKQRVYTQFREQPGAYKLCP